MMNLENLDRFLFRFTESEERHRLESGHPLSSRYEQIPKVLYEGREIYQFSFQSLLEERNICVHKESRFTYIPEHVHTVIEFLYVYAGRCTQTIGGRRIAMEQGDICLLDTNVPHSIEFIEAEDIIITIEMRKEYLIQGFLQRLGNSGIITHFLVNALSLNAAHDQSLLFKKQDHNAIHSILQHILCEYYDPKVCSDKIVDAYMVLLFCELLRQYKNRAFSSNAGSKIVEILEYIETNYLTVTLQETARQFGFHPNYLSSYIKKETGYSFKELVIFQRMGQACFYLSKTDLPIYEIASRVGYNNVGFFYRKFEEIYKMKPALYREAWS